MKTVSSGKGWLVILFIGVALSTIIRCFFLFHGAALADVLRMYQVAVTVLGGQNPYSTPGFYIYSPLWMYIELVTLVGSRALGLSFQSAIKLWPNVADIAIAFLIYFILTKDKVKRPVAVFWSLVYIFSPISIIVSSIHGQFDSLVSLFTLLALYFLTNYTSRKCYLLSGLFLGIAIAFKSNPAILVPFFLFYKKVDFKVRLYYLAAVGLPLVLVLLPFVSISPLQALGGLMGYSGFNDFGIGGILRGLWYQNNAELSFPYSSEILNISKFAFLSILFLFFINFLRRRPAKVRLYRTVLVVYLLFLTVYSGISGQYFSWVLFGGALLREKMLVYYSVAGGLALIGFYLFFNPSVIITGLDIVPHQSFFMSWYFFANLFTWILGVLWLVELARVKLK